MSARALYALLFSVWSLVGQAFMSVPGIRWEGELLLQPQQLEWENSSGNRTHDNCVVEERRGSRERFLRDHVHFGLAAAAGLGYQSQPAHALFGGWERGGSSSCALGDCMQVAGHVFDSAKNRMFWTQPLFAAAYPVMMPLSAAPAAAPHNTRFMFVAFPTVQRYTFSLYFYAREEIPTVGSLCVLDWSEIKLVSKFRG